MQSVFQYSDCFTLYEEEIVLSVTKNHLVIEFSASFKTITLDRILKTTQKGISCLHTCNLKNMSRTEAQTICTLTHMPSTWPHRL